MLDLRQLQALLALAQEGSVSRAAKQLGWSQPTINYHLHNLDALIGAELTTRTSRGTTLTATGALMRGHAETILALADRALTDARELAHQGRTRVRFGTFPTAAAQLLPGIAKRADAVRIELETELAEIPPLVNRINQHTLDAALVYVAGGYQLPFNASVHTTLLFNDPLQVALASDHPLAHLTEFDLDSFLQLADEKWVLGSTPGDTLDDMVREVFAAGGKKPTVTIRTDDYQVVLGLIAAGMGVSLVPRMASTNLPENVVLRPVKDKRFTRRVLLAAPGSSGGPSITVRHLAQAIREAVSDFSSKTAGTHPSSQQKQTGAAATAPKAPQQ